MKRVRCPKCDHYVIFDETRYKEGQSLVFVCDECKKQFGIRIGKSGPDTLQKDERPDGQENRDKFGSIVVIENSFAYKQVLPLREGDNVIGRRSKGTDIEVPIESSDRNMDRRHCIVNVKRDRQGTLAYTLRDCRSLCGTYVMNELLGDKERVRIEDGAVITIGATTVILRTADKE